MDRRGDNRKEPHPSRKGCPCAGAGGLGEGTSEKLEIPFSMQRALVKGSCGSGGADRQEHYLGDDIRG